MATKLPNNPQPNVPRIPPMTEQTVADYLASVKTNVEAVSRLLPPAMQQLLQVTGTDLVPPFASPVFLDGMAYCAALLMSVLEVAKNNKDGLDTIHTGLLALLYGVTHKQENEDSAWIPDEI